MEPEARSEELEGNGVVSNSKLGLTVGAHTWSSGIKFFLSNMRL
jgi:hypothetical protein